MFKEYNEDAGESASMRGGETPEYLYLFNPWSDGRHHAYGYAGNETYKRMKELAPGWEAPPTTRPL